MKGRLPVPCHGGVGSQVNDPIAPGLRWPESRAHSEVLAPGPGVPRFVEMSSLQVCSRQVWARLVQAACAIAGYPGWVGMVGADGRLEPWQKSFWKVSRVLRRLDPVEPVESIRQIQCQRHLLGSLASSPWTLLCLPRSAGPNSRERGASPERCGGTRLPVQDEGVDWHASS